MKKWKDDLKQGFTAPPPRRKEAFLSQFAPMHLSLAEVVMLQARYIRKWTWVASAVVLVIALMTLTILPKDGLWAVSGMTPLLALVVVTESGRSQKLSYGGAGDGDTVFFALCHLSAVGCFRDC